MQHFIELINNTSLYRNCTDYMHMLHHTVDHRTYNSWPWIPAPLIKGRPVEANEDTRKRWNLFNNFHHNIWAGRRWQTKTKTREYINKLPREQCDVATQKSNICRELYQTIHMQHFIELINNISLNRNCTDFLHMLHHTVHHRTYSSWPRNSVSSIKGKPVKVNEDMRKRWTLFNDFHHNIWAGRRW